MYLSLHELDAEKLRERASMPVLGSVTAPKDGKLKELALPLPPTATLLTQVGSRTVRTTVDPPLGVKPAAGVVGVEMVTVNGLLPSTESRHW